MYEIEWASPKEFQFKNCYDEDISKLNDKIKKIAPLLWTEHCVECAAPECYGACAHYRAREDGQCRLFENGILPLPALQGTLGYGVLVRFEGWAKIQAFCHTGQYPINSIKRLDRLANRMARYDIKRLRKKDRQITGLTKLGRFPRRMAQLKGEKYTSPPDAFVIGLINEEAPFSMIVEVSTDTQLKFRTALSCAMGYTEQIIPFSSMNITGDELHRLTVYPENTAEGKTVIFTALDFVTFKEQVQNATETKQETKAAKEKKIKCVVWDLDNTLWSGVLIENENVILNENAVSVIKELDRRGIISSVLSKNDHEQAYDKIKSFGLDEYFVMPQISWNPKSIGIKKIADDINIGIDTLAFVDDSIFERTEVAEKYPEVLCIDAVDIDNILTMPAFDVIVTAESAKRRHTYKMLEQQKKEIEAWDGNIDDFLRSCKMVLTLGKPKAEEMARCHELLQRTNQLNSSGRRLTMDEVMAIYHDDHFETYALICEDRFGNYGLVGFSIVELGEEATITDFVISCRVANKKVENTYMMHLAEKYQAKGYDRLYINYRKTVKNGPIYKVVSDMKMSKAEGNDEMEKFYIPLTEKLQPVGIMEIIERDKI